MRVAPFAARLEKLSVSLVSQLPTDLVLKMVPPFEGKLSHSLDRMLPSHSSRTPTLAYSSLNRTKFWTTCSGPMEMAKFHGPCGEARGYPSRQDWDWFGEEGGRDVGMRCQHRANPYYFGVTKGLPLRNSYANGSVNWNFHILKCRVPGEVRIARKCWRRRDASKYRTSKTRTRVSNCGNRKLLWSTCKRCMV